MKRGIICTSSSSSNNSLSSESSQPKVSLVERNPNPNGLALVNSKRSGKNNYQDMVSLAKEIQEANSMISAVTCGKLKLISDQIKRLQEEAMEIMEEGLHNLDLHKVSCNFIKIPGAVYHLYQRDSGQKYFSMLSPKDWNSAPPHHYIGSYRLNYDRSWAEVNDCNEICPSPNYFREQFSRTAKRSSDDSLLSETEMETESLDFQINANEDKHLSLTHNSKNSRRVKNSFQNRDYL